MERLRELRTRRGLSQTALAARAGWGRSRVCDLEAGRNLTTVTLLCNIAAGASVLFWNSSFEALTERGNRGERFKALMEEHYPWHSDDAATGRAGAEAIWDFTRSPLTHTLGVGKDMATFPGPATRSR